MSKAKKRATRRLQPLSKTASMIGAATAHALRAVFAKHGPTMGVSKDDLFGAVKPAMLLGPHYRGGMPPNVSPFGGVMRAPNFIVRENYDTKLVRGHDPDKPMLKVPVHRSVHPSIYKAQVNAAKRKARGRYVW